MNRLNKYIPNFLLSVLLIFSIAGLSVISLVSGSLLSPEYYADSAQKHDVYEHVSAYAEDYFAKSYDVSGIPSEVYMDALGEKSIKQAVDGKIACFLNYVNGKTDTIEKADTDFTQLEQNLSNFFDEFAKENNVDVNDEFTAQLDNTIKTAESEIETFTNVYMLDFMEKAGLHEKLRTIAPLLPTFQYYLIAAVAVCVILICIFNKKRITSALYWISASGLCSSILMLLPCLIIDTEEYFSRLMLRTNYVYYAVTGLLNDAVASFMNYQYVILAVSVALMIIFIIVSVILNKDKKDA